MNLKNVTKEVLSQSLQLEQFQKEDDVNYYETMKLKQLRVINADEKVKYIRFDILFQEKIQNDRKEEYKMEADGNDDDEDNAEGDAPGASSKKQPQVAEQGMFTNCCGSKPHSNDNAGCTINPILFLRTKVSQKKKRFR